MLTHGGGGLADQGSKLVPGPWSPAAALVAVLLLLLPATGRATPRGDINFDDTVDAADVVLLQRHLAGEVTLAGRALVAADVAPADGSALQPDGNVDSGDLVVLLQVASGDRTVSHLSEPVLAALPASITHNGLHVTGTAPTGSVVDLYVDGVKVATATAQAGAFGADVFLGAVGPHEIFATRAVGAEVSGPSAPQTVTYSDAGNTYTSTSVASSGQTVVWYPLPGGEAYRLEGDITVAAGGALRIHAGAQVVFASAGATSGRLLVDGVLRVEGAAGLPVVFTAAGGSTTRGSWTGIRLQNGGTATIDQAKVSYAARGFVITGAGTQATITNTEISGFVDVAGDGYGVGIFSSAQATLQGNTIHQGGWSGSACLAGDGYRQGRGVRVDNASSNTLIEGSTIVCSDEGFFVERSAPKIRSNLITQNVAGIVVDRDGDPEVSQGNLILSNRETGIRIKRTSLGYPFPTVNHNTIQGNGVEAGTPAEVQVLGLNSSASIPRIDMERNDWGTTDSAAIMARIDDALDDPAESTPGTRRAVIDFVPFVDGQGTAYLGHHLVWGIPRDGNPDGLSVAPGIYYGNRTTRVDANQTVTIPAGVTVKFEKGATFSVPGHLEVSGTAEEPVTFESVEASPAPGDWVGIYTTREANIRHARIRHARVAVRVDTWGLSVHDSIIELFEDPADLAQSVGIRSSGSAGGSIRRNTIRGNCGAATPYGTGIWFENSRINSQTVGENTIECLDRGVLMQSSQVNHALVGNTIRDNATGIVAEVRLPTLTGNTISDNSIGILLVNAAVPSTSINARRNAIHQNGTNLKLQGYSDGASQIELDFRENYWGSTDAATIYGTFDLAGAGPLPAAVVLFSDPLDGAPNPDGSLPSGVSPVPATYATAPIQSVSPGPLVFWPRAPGSFPVDLVLRAASDVTLWICPGYDTACSAGEAVRTQSYGTLPGGAGGTTHALGWDGKDDAGLFVADGVYAFAIRAVDAAVPAIQNTYDPSGSQPQSLAFTLGWAGYSATPRPSQNALENVLPGVDYTIGTRPGGRTLQWVYLTKHSQGTGEDPNYLVGPVYAVPGDAGSLVWDGRDPSTGAFLEGPFTLRFHGKHVQKPNFVIVRGTVPEAYSSNDPPRLEIQTNPFRMHHSFSEVSEVRYRITRDAHVRILLLPPGIYDPAAPEAVEVQASTFQSALDGSEPRIHAFRWDNVDATDPGLARLGTDGEWTVAIEVSDPTTPSLKSLYRGVLQLRR